MVLAAVLVVLCSGPVVRLVKGTVDASQGAGSPSTAVMGGVDQWADVDLGRVAVPEFGAPSRAAGAA